MRVLVLILVMFSLVACGGKRREAKRTETPTTNSFAPRYGDLDPAQWRGAAPWNYPIHGVDVSKFQQNIDWNTVRRAGIRFAFIKATEGGDHLDSLFHQNWQGAARAGIKRGAYHFFYFCRPAYQQARWFIQNVPKTRGALPPVLDMEWNHLSRSCKFRPPAAQVRREIAEFSSIVSQHYGTRPIIYTSPDFYRDNQLGAMRGYEFWLRSVADHPAYVYGRQPWSFWQYTGTGLVPGVRGKTDINVFAGTPNAWNDWLKRRVQ